MHTKSHSIFFAVASIIFVFAVTFGSTAKSQDNSNTAVDNDRIYKGGEVDKKAVLDKKHWEMNAPSPEGCKGSSTVTLGAVLRKSGKVTNIRVSEPGSCPDFEKRAIKTVERVKFKPAIKDGAPVSTYMQFEFNFNCGGECP